jgi:hypothetical protein
MVLAAHGRRAVLWSAVRLAHSGGALEQAVTGALCLSFQWGLLLQHRGDTGSSFSSALGGVSRRRRRAAAMTFD